ncbi:MAG: glycosyltransferase family 39 protein [Candidatus Latescibacteria bacterium]|nr:glycosyltransferase family 39 protein [Candidatus Latescibacterota bacterium]
MPSFSALCSSLSVRLQAAPYTAASMGVLLVAAYLCLVNLDYAALWHDEAPAAFFGKTLLQQGSITGWDGRNLVGGTNGRTLNEELRGVLPPLMYALNAVGLAIFGVNETGARIVHAIIGIAALGVFYLLLGQHLSKHSRLMFFIFAFTAGSAQLLLYFRQSRYFSVMVLALILLFYLYERYWRSKHLAYLPALSLVAALSFFNHYASGAATMLSLAAYHLLFRARATTRREWVLFAICGAAVVAVGTSYLYWLGVIGGERSGFMGFAGQAPTPYQGDKSELVIFIERIWIYTRELFTADWISWPVFSWFAGMALIAWQTRRKQAVGASRQVRRRAQRANAGTSIAQKILGDDFPLAAAGKIILMGALFALFSAMLSVQPIWLNPVADLRYYVGALPLLLAMKGLFVEWAWRRHIMAGTVALVVLLFSSVGAAPFNIAMHFSGQKTLGLHLFEFIREVHRPYRDSISVVSSYLLQNADRDDLVYVPGFANREVLIFYAGDHVRFCCVLDETTPLPKDKIAALDAPLYIEQNTPDWIVGFGGLRRGRVEQFAASYEVIAKLKVHPYPTQRPELNFHAFSPLDPGDRGVFILRRQEE